MDATAIATLWETNIASYGLAVLAVLGGLIILMVGLLVFNFGYKTLLNLPGGMGYNSQKPSGMSRFRQGSIARNGKPGKSLI